MPTCEADNTAAVDQSDFWSSDGIDWDAHRIGWAISGGCAALVRPLQLCPRRGLTLDLADCHHLHDNRREALQVRSCPHYPHRARANAIAVRRSYTVPNEQRQMCVIPDSSPLRLRADRAPADSLRILYMPPVYAIISFFSYRFFRSYTYYELIEVGESILPSQGNE